jgi:hypothetical protein
MARLMEKVFLFTTVPPEKSFGKGQQLSPTLQTTGFVRAKSGGARKNIKIGSSHRLILRVS